MSKNFAMTGVAGFVAPRHLKAINDTGNRLVAAVDPHDAVGVLDRYSFDVALLHRDRALRSPSREAAARPRGRARPLRDASARRTTCTTRTSAWRCASGADAICEKPLVINPWNLDALQELERETGRRVYTVLQLRLHPDLVALQARLDAERPGAAARR